MNKQFSTGSGELDRYVGGVGDGDSVLFIQGAFKDSRPLVKIFTDHLRRQDHTLRYLNVNDSWTPLLTGVRVRNVSPKTRAAKKSDGLYRWAAARIREIGRGENIVLDDLAEWHRLLGAGGRLVSLIQLLSKSVVRKKAFAFMTVTRGNLGVRTLSLIKDSVDVSLELSIQEGDLLLHPLGTRGRLTPRPSSPFGFRLSRGRGSTGKTLSAIPDFHHGPGNTIRARHEERERIAELLLHGPLNFASTGLVVADLSGTFRSANDHILKQLGLNPGDITSTNPAGFVALAGRRRFLKFLAEARRHEVASAELLLQSAAGKIHPVLIKSNRIDAGLHVFMVYDNRDGEAATREARARDAEYTQLFDNAPYALCVAD